MTRRIALLSVLVTAAAALGQEPQKQEAPKTQETKVATTQPAVARAYVKLETTLGDILLELDGEKAPISVKNFLDYVDAGFYNGTVFHRVMSNFMIQGGGFTPEMDEKKEGLRPPIQNEWQNGLKNQRGSIAMARTAVADSATAQFFINVADNIAGGKHDLDTPRPQGGNAAYAVFGKVVAGMDAVDRIRNTEVKVDPKLGPMGKVVPVEPVVIKAAKRVAADEVQTAIKQAQEAAAKAQAEAQAAAEKQLQDVIAKIEQEAGKKIEKTASGLMYVVLKEGTGPSPKPTDMIEVHYVGVFLDGKKFESSRDGGKPYRNRLDGVIKGWTEGVGMMKTGELRKLIIPPDLAYGANPRPGSGIPPNSTLVFEIELLSINPQP